MPYVELTYALCRSDYEVNHVPYWDYDLPGEDPEPRLERLTYGLDVCGMCRELDACYSWAKSNQDQISGVWGQQIFVPMEDKNRYVKCIRCDVPVFGADKRNSKYAGQSLLCPKCANR